MKSILNSKEIAKYCGVSLETIHRWIENKNLQGCQVFDREEYLVELNHFLNFLKTSRLVLNREFQAHSHRVLIVDDDVGMANSIKRTLGMAGFVTKVCNDGFHAGVELGNFNPTVVTLDIRMPMVSGFEIMKFIRTTEFLKNTKIMMISAMPKQELDVAIKIGADEVLSKPFQNEDLVRVAMGLSIEAIMEGQARAAGGKQPTAMWPNLEAQVLCAF